jgi:tyrosinase
MVKLQVPSSFFKQTQMYASLLLLTSVLACINQQHVTVRKEWRQMSKDHQQRYISAVLCLKNTPSRLKVGSPSRYDDIVYAHMKMTDDAEQSSKFLPELRAFLFGYEDILAYECGYNEGVPYWDASSDASFPELSPIWNVIAI